LWHSTNGGNIWTKKFTIAAPLGIAADGCPCDQTIDYGTANRIAGTFLISDTYFTAKAFQSAIAAVLGLALIAPQIVWTKLYLSKRPNISSCTLLRFPYWCLAQLDRVFH
jgi:hypothetical protein